MSNFTRREFLKAGLAASALAATGRPSLGEARQTDHDGVIRDHAAELRAGGSGPLDLFEESPWTVS